MVIQPNTSVALTVGLLLLSVQDATNEKQSESAYRVLLHLNLSAYWVQFHSAHSWMITSPHAG